MTQATNAQATHKERQKTKPKSVVSVPAKISVAVNAEDKLIVRITAEWSLPNGQVAKTETVTQPVDLPKGGWIGIQDLPIRMQIA